MTKRQVWSNTIAENWANGKTSEPQADEQSTPSKNKMIKGTSKIVDALDKPDTAPGAIPTSELVDENKNDLPISGCQHGTKNYTVEELEMLTNCMAFAAPIGPDEVSKAIDTYVRIVKDKGWPERNEKALRQKWDKVKRVYKLNFAEAHWCKRSQLSNRRPERMG